VVSATVDGAFLSSTRSQGGVSEKLPMRSIDDAPLTVFAHRKASGRLPHACMDAERDRFWNPQGPVHAPPWSVMTEDHHARFVEEQTADKVVAHPPKRGKFVDREMPFERHLTRCHVLLQWLIGPHRKVGISPGTLPMAARRGRGLICRG
jgi:hypothetical protein